MSLFEQFVARSDLAYLQFVNLLFFTTVLVPRVWYIHTSMYKKTKQKNKTQQHAKSWALVLERNGKKMKQKWATFVRMHQASTTSTLHMQIWHDKLKPSNSRHNRKALLHFTVGTTMLLTTFDVKQIEKKMKNTAPKTWEKKLRKVLKSRHCEMDRQRNGIFCFAINKTSVCNKILEIKNEFVYYRGGYLYILNKYKMFPLVNK